MSHYTISYDHITDPKEKQAKAIQDIKDYLSVKTFKAVCRDVHKDQTITRESFIRQLSMFAGIEGYPAQAWADELGLVKTSADPSNKTPDSACNTPNLG